MAKRLVISLVGRICLVTKGGESWAVFVNARHNRKLALRDHRPLLTVPLSMVARQHDADTALLTSATLVTPSGSATPMIDSLGVWSLAHQELSFRGVGAGGGTRTVSDLADLNAIARSVDQKAAFEAGIIGPHPGRFGVLARLRLPKGADIVAVTDDPIPKTFIPGGHKQVVATYLRCEVPFANDLVGPTLLRRDWKSKRVAAIRFSGRIHTNVTLVMSNLCNCVKPAPKRRRGLVQDDPEFGMYFELLETDLPGSRPVPHVPLKLAGVHVPECYGSARLAF